MVFRQGRWVRRAVAVPVLAWGVAFGWPAGEARGENGEGRAAVPVAATTSNAAADVAPAGAPPLGGTLRQVSASGGWILKVLVVMALAGGWMVIRVLRVSRLQHVVPSGLHAELLERVRAGELGEARRLCEDRPGPLSTIALQAFDQVRYAPRAGVLVLRDTLETEGARQAGLMLSQAQVLRDFAVIAPMLGLLGTVLGLLQVFGAAGQELPAARAAAQAGGMMQALVTMAAGLLVAIPATACHAWLQRRLMRRIAAMESAMSELLIALAGRYDR